MQQGYFDTAWKDIKNTPGWIKKILLLTLLQIVPIFGQIVLFGYLYGWARNIAWGLSGTMPEKIFGNADGKLYSRGFFILVLQVVIGLIIILPFMPSYVALLAQAFSYSPHDAAIIPALMLMMVGCLVSLALSVLSIPFLMIAPMRISVYGNLSSGFQFKKIWKMFRHDPMGILKIVGMMLIVGMVIATIVVPLVMLITYITAFIFGAGVAGMVAGSGSIVAFAFGSIILFVVNCVVWFLYCTLITWMYALQANALGYWTRQLNVAAWRGQDDPLPFELQQPTVMPPPQQQD